MRLLHVVTATLVVGLAACSSAPTAVTPEVTQEGRYLVWYTGREMRAELGYRWASSHLGDEWLVLKLSLVSAGGSAPVVERDAVRVRTPDGHTLALIEQQEFRRIFGKLRTALDRIDAWGPPTNRFAGFREPCKQWFLAPPGMFLDRSSLRLNANRWCGGPLVFQVPIGVQPGHWVLMIDLEESDVRIPFELAEEGISPARPPGAGYRISSPARSRLVTA
jgi:hypothetical protein